MSKEIINSDKAPEPIGPYSQAVKANGFLFVSGQIPLDRATGKLVAGDIKTETQRVMDNLKEILTAGGLDFSHVVKCSIFLTDMKHFPEVNEVYGQYVGTTSPPARETVAVCQLPMGVRVEISCMAIAG